MAVGKIKWYSHQLGHGFIICEDPPGDVFVRTEDLVTDPLSLDNGDEVTFELVDGPQGKEAREVFKTPLTL